MDRTSLPTLSSVSRFVAGVSICLSLAACGDDSVLDRAKRLKEQVCACKDTACVTKLEKNSKELEAEMSKLSGRELEQALEISVAIMECSTSVDAKK